MKNTVIGAILALSSALIYAVQTALVKGWGGAISIPVLVFIQSMVCLLMILPVVFAKGGRETRQILKTNNIKIHFMRTLFSLGISYFLFSAVKFIPLVDAVLLTNTAPLIIPFLGLLFMSQKINHRLWLPLIVGFLGIALILRPNGDVFQFAALLGLGAGICMAASIMLVRQASKEDGALTNVFYYFLFSVPISAAGAVIFWSPISWQQLLILIGIGILFFSVQITLVFSLKYTSAQTVASLYLMNIVFSAFISWIIWSAHLTSIMICGMMIAIIGSFWTIQAQGIKKSHQIKAVTVNE